MRAIVAAVLAIAAIEATVYLVRSSTFVERSALIDASYGEDAQQHRLVLYEKLQAFAYSDPDAIQVGDSSGLHAVDPSMLGGRYLNMSCCANAGFGGYYDLADFMFRRNANIKHLVLYASIMVLPMEGTVNK